MTTDNRPITVAASRATATDISSPLVNAGIDLHQPAVLQAADACVSVTDGVLTKAAVARFVAGQ